MSTESAPAPDALNPDRYRLSEAEHQRIFERRVVPALFGQASPVARPVAVMLGGQPGAGKSPLVDQAVVELADRGGAVLVIGDDLRGFHPRYRQLLADDDKTAAFYTDRDSGGWVQKAIAHAKSLQVNLVIEGTMRSAETVAGTMRDLREAGYLVDARVLAVNERWSWQGVLQRYEAQKADRGTARMTAAHSHQAAYEGSPLTVERIEANMLADRLAIVRRGGSVLYANQLVEGQWRHPAQGRAALEAERARPLTLDEHQALVSGFERLVEQIEKPERRAGPDEVRRIAQLLDDARRQRDSHVLVALPRSSAVHLSPTLASAYEFLDAVAGEATRRGMSRPDAETGLEVARVELAKRIAAGTFSLRYPSRGDVEAMRATNARRIERNSGDPRELDR